MIKQPSRATAVKAEEAAATTNGTFAQVARAEADQAALVAKNAEANSTRLSTVAQNEQNVSVGLGTALIGYLTGSITLHQLATAAATTATTLFTMALNALPLIGIAAAIGAVVAGIVALVSWLGNSDQAYKEGKQYIEDYGEANDALAESLDESTSNFNKNRNAAKANANTSRKMLEGLKELSSKGLGRTAKETYQLQAKINALNSAQKGLNLTINEATGEMHSWTSAGTLWMA